METTENVDSNVHRSPLAALEDAQAAYIRKLEDRLDALENRMLNIEEAGPGNDIAINENESSMDSESDDSISSDGSYVNKKEGVEANHPPFPPTVAEVRGVDFVQATHHVFMASSIPAIEFAKFPEKESEEDTKLATFKNAFKDFSPKEALEMINSNYMKPHDVDLRLLFDHINILSMPLSQILWSIYYDKTLPPNQIARFVRPWRVCIYHHKHVKRKLSEMEKEQERALDSKAEPSGEIYKNSMLLDELRAYVRLMEDTVMEYYATFKTKTAADNLKIYYVDIWHLFEPGEIIYYSEAKDAPSKMDYSKLERSKRPDQKLWRVYSRLRSDDGWCVKAYCIDYDGESYVCVKEWFMIESFEGRKSVNSLRVYPVRFATNAKRLMEDATEAGRGFIKNLDSKLLGHEGWTWVSDQSSGTSLIYVSGDVVIDFAEAFRVHPDWKPIPMAPAIYYGGGWGTDNDDDDRTRWYWTDGHELKWFHPRVISLSDTNAPRLTKTEYVLEKDRFLSWILQKGSSEWTPQEEDLCLLPSRPFCYSLQDRRFVAVDVRNLRQIEDNKNKFDNLIINPTHKGMLQALVESHFRRKDLDGTITVSTNQDIVQHKGRGLVILLHGVPGVGKTSTAEMIASSFNRPLLPITCGDLGLDPATVEKSLKQMFRVGQLWDCILLLDEADVFLSQRISSDLNRNALVSVFLRVLDYYSGILFLTTNRVGTIDEAFKSRIHISLYYPNLGLEQTEKIWKVNLDRLEAIEAEQSVAQPPLSIDRKGILRFAKKQYVNSNSGKGEWNGRQIRNAFLIASALAHSEKTNGVPKGANKCDLRAKHFRTVAEAQSGFERYLFETTGTTDEKAAHDQGTRADHVVSADGRVAPQTPVPTPAQPVQPPIHPAVMASQYPSHQPLTPTRNPTTYNLSHSPNNVYLQQPHPHPHPQPQPQPQHYVYGQAPQDTFGQPSATTGHPVQWALTPGSSQPQRPRPQPHVADSDSDT